MQQFSDLPTQGAVLQQFWSTYDSYSSTATGTVRIGLYTVSRSTYTLLASTNASSDLYVLKTSYGFSGTCNVIRSNGPLYYSNASATLLTLDPTTATRHVLSHEQLSRQSSHVHAGVGNNCNHNCVEYNQLHDWQHYVTSMTASGTSDAAYQMWITVSVPTSTVPTVSHTTNRTVARMADTSNNRAAAGC